MPEDFITKLFPSVNSNTLNALSLFLLENIRGIVNIEFFIITFLLSGPHRLKLFHCFN